MLEQGIRTEELQAKAKEFNDMSQVSKKRATQLRQHSMWDNAKHGALVRTTVTGDVRAIVILPLISRAHVQNKGISNKSILL
jgi:hypothetical protein